MSKPVERSASSTSSNRHRQTETQESAESLESQFERIKKLYDQVILNANGHGLFTENLMFHYYKQLVQIAMKVPKLKDRLPLWYEPFDYFPLPQRVTWENKKK